MDGSERMENLRLFLLREVVRIKATIDLKRMSKKLTKDMSFNLIYQTETAFSEAVEQVIFLCINHVLNTVNPRLEVDL